MSAAEYLAEVKGDLAEVLETWLPESDDPTDLIGSVSEIKALVEQSERLVAALEAVLGELAGHPECDVHPDDDPVTCGWKSAVIGVRRAIEEVLGEEEGHVATGD